MPSSDRFPPFRSSDPSAALPLSRWLVRRYPQPWRERYETEMLALLDDAPPRARDVLDLARGLAVERLRSTFEPGDRPVLAGFLLGVGQLGLAMAVPLAAFAVAWGGRFWFGVPPRSFGDAGLLLHLVVVVMWTVGMARRYSATLAAHQGMEPLPPLFPPRTATVWLGAMAGAMFLDTWAASFDDSRMVHLLLYGGLLAPQLSGLRWRQLHAAGRRLSVAKHELPWAIMELDRCERLAAQGLPSPLQEARDTIVRLTARRDEALATLHGMGYRASLSRTGRPI